MILPRPKGGYIMILDILGSGEFVQGILGEADEKLRRQIQHKQREHSIEEVIEKMCAEGGVKADELRGGVSLLQVIQELREYLRGWMGYFRLVETSSVFQDLDSWIRRRLRCFVAKATAFSSAKSA